MKRLENYHVQVKEFKDKIIFLRSIVKGMGNKSYGIHVGEMAGLPKTVIARANQVLKDYMENPIKNERSIPNDIDAGLVKNYDSILNLIRELDSIDINNTTPFQALEILARLKRKNEE